MRNVDEICSILDKYAQEIPRVARTIAQARTPRFPHEQVHRSILEAKLNFCVAQCGYAFHEWQVQGHDDILWPKYNEQFVDILQKYHPAALESISMRYAA